MIGQYITLTYIVADRATTVLGRITGAHTGLIQAQRTMLSVTTGLTLGMLGLGATGARAVGSLKRNFIELNAQADETRLGIAGMLNALGYSSSMTQAQSQSKKLYDQLLRLSGPLPGEAEAYINSFQLSIGALSNSMEGFQKKYGDKGLFGGSSGFDREMTGAKDKLSKMAAFSAYWQATAVSSNVSEALAARDLPRLLSGNVTTMTRTWQKMAPQFQAASGGKVTDTKSFKALTDADRMELMVKVIHRMSGAVDLMSDKQSALNGAIQTTIKQWKMLAGEKAYGIYLTYLKQFDHYLREHKTQLDKVADTVSKHLVSGLVRLKMAMTDSFGWFLRHKDKIIAGFADIKSSFSNGLDGNRRGHGASVFSNVANGAGRFGHSMRESYGLANKESGGHPAAMALGAVATAGMLARIVTPILGVGGIATAADAIAGLELVGEAMLGAVTGLLTVPALITAAIAAPFAALAAGMIQGAVTTPGAVEAPARLMNALMDLVAPIMQILDPFMVAGKVIGSFLVEVAVPFVEVITSVIGLFLSFFAAIIKLTEMFLGLNSGLGETKDAFHKFGTFLHWLAMKIRSYFLFADNPDPGSWEGYERGQRVHSNSMVDIYSGLFDEQGPSALDLARGAGSAFTDTAGKKAKTPGGRSSPYYDFRGSRFDITQKFAEGFDPDRIAVSFMNALEATADQATASKMPANMGAR